ncbi:MAG: tRNA pseudouridine(38-40) synthase TruA [Kiritimatiellae bacterium]|nr:tRNA pseudouridine(38-40) synthase TruA [Kiritimatiellia bacterium]
MTRRYRMTIAYDGTAYAGWQVQPGKRTIQGEIEHALAKVTGEKCRIHASGRTDAGVHARAQVAHFDLSLTVRTDRLLTSLDAVLEADIRIGSLTRTKPDFHARYGARGKEYRYFIWNDAVVPPFLYRYRTRADRPLDVDAMRDAARRLQGKHDFAAFSANPQREVEGTVRDLDTLAVRRRGAEVVIIAHADGFLYKMVRSLAGFLMRVGEGAVPAEEATVILKSRLRTARVPTAPPEGLFLWRVSY